MGLNSLLLLTYFAPLTTLVSKCSIYDSPCLAELGQKFATSIILNSLDSSTGSLDPMFIAPIKVDEDKISYALKDIQILGTNNVFIEKVQFNKQAKSVRIKAGVPCLTILANYTSAGYFQNLPYFGNGKAVINHNGFENDVIFNYEIIKEKNGKDYFDLKSYTYWFDISKSDTYLENLNKDEPIKALETQEYMQKEYRRIWQQFGRYIFNEYNDKIFESIKKFLLSQPAEDILYDY